MPMIFNQCGPPPAAADPPPGWSDTSVCTAGRLRRRERVPWAGALAPPSGVLTLRWRIAWAIPRGVGGLWHRGGVSTDDRFRRCLGASARRHWYVAWTPCQGPPAELFAQLRGVALAGARPRKTLHASDAFQTQGVVRHVAPQPEGG